MATSKTLDRKSNTETFCGISTKRVLFIITIVTQFIILLNGVVTLTTDSLAEQAFKKYTATTLPQLANLKSLSWRNWKINELLVESLILNSTMTPNVYQYYTMAYKSAIEYEDSQITSAMTNENVNISALISKLKNGIEASILAGAPTTSYDADLVALDNALISQLNSHSSSFEQSLSHLQQETKIVMILNGVFLGIISVFRVIEGYLCFSITTRGSQSLEVFGAMSHLGLSVLECAAFLTMTTIRFNDIQKLIDLIYPLYNAAWGIKYYDPILTGSAMRFVYSNGSTEWLDRYNAAIDPLIASIDVARSLAVSASEKLLFNLTDTANTVLVELETIALNDSVAGVASLTGDAYTTNKQIYLYAIDLFVSKQETSLYSSFVSSATLTTVLLYCASFFTAISLLNWVRELIRLFDPNGNLKYRLKNSLTSTLAIGHDHVSAVSGSPKVILEGSEKPSDVAPLVISSKEVKDVL